jgi:hypothetical protein
MMEEGLSLKATLLGILDRIASGFTDFVPRILAALCVILLGWIVVKMIEKGIRTSFDKFRIDTFLERIGLSDTLQKMGMRESPGRVLARTVYYLLMIFFVQSAAEAAGLTTIANVIGSFFTYLPHLLAALLVLFVGIIIAQFLGKAVTQTATDSGVDYAPLLGRIVSALVLFVMIVMAITQLQFDTQVVISVVLVMLSGVALALALSFGLGSRDVTRNIMAGFYARKLFRIGEDVEIGGERGTLVSITPIQTLIERDQQTIAIPNRVFLDEVVRQ